MLKQIEIKGFKGFSSVRIGPLSSVNLRNPGRGYRIRLRGTLMLVDQKFEMTQARLILCEGKDDAVTIRRRVPNLAAEIVLVPEDPEETGDGVGALEDLFVSDIASPEHQQCVEQLFTCIDGALALRTAGQLGNSAVASTKPC